MGFTSSAQPSGGFSSGPHAWHGMSPRQVKNVSPAQWLFAITIALFLAAITILLYAEMLFAPFTWWRWVAIMLLSWWLPGTLIIWRWSPPDLDWPTALVLAAGAGWCWQVALLIAMHWIPGPLTYPLFVGGYSAGMVLLLYFCRHTPLRWKSVQKRTIGWLLLLLIVAMTARLPFLGAHEFHQDETHLLRRANEAIRGSDDALARHTKGVGEIAVVMVTYRALQTIDEWTARLPFALAGVGSILALGLLGKRLFGNSVGFTAGLLFALNGFALGLSRIAQYQGAVLLLSALALLTMWEFARRGQPRWLALSLFFSAFGLVMHYEFLLNALPLLMLFIIGWRRIGPLRPRLQALLWTGCGGVLVVAATYLPLLFNPYFATTRAYLSSRIDNLQANNFAFFMEMGTFYNSIYFAVGLLLLVGVGIYVGWRSYRSQATLLVLWFLPAALFYLFIVQYPGTHFYFMMPAWSILAALALIWLDNRIRHYNFVAYWGWHGGLMLWIVLSTFYLYLLFFRQSPSYLVNYAESRLPLYWAPYGENIPRKPRFGFPMKQGWKTLGVLAEWQYMGESYASNERSDILRWYLRGFDRVEATADPDFIFVAKAVQERDRAYDDDILEERFYQQIGEVRVRGESRIAIWARAPMAGGYVTYDAELFDQAFDEAAPALVDWLHTPTTVINETLDHAITLQGVTRNCDRMEANSTLHLTIWWQVKTPLAHDYKLFVHIADETGYPIAQWDGLPGQNTQRTTTWQPGLQFQDNVLIALPEDMPAGEYAILIGFYNPATGNRLGEEAIETMTIKVRT